MDPHVSGCQRVPEGPDPCLPQRPKIHLAVRPGSFSERSTTGLAQRTLRRHVGSKPTRTAPRGGPKSSARRYLCAPAAYALSSKRQGCRSSTALRPTWVRRWHISNRPTLHPSLTRLWLTSRSPQLWWKKSVWRPSPRHLRQAGIRAVDPIDLRIASSPPSRRRSTNLGRTLL
jgi:hypothetical protein